MRLKQTWRWFGPDDPVSLQDVKQAGATGIVSALHQIPHGELWPVEEIIKRKEIIEAAGLTWDVVESVTVLEAIKTRSGNYQQHINDYKQTLRNIAASGIPVVTYNFMPVNDWTRTNLDYTMPDGSKALYFNWFDLAVFDIYILKRTNAADSYTTTILNEAEKRFKNYSTWELDELSRIIRIGLPGEKKVTVEEMRENLKVYNDIDRQALRENLKHFLSQIAEVAEAEGIRLAIHPDDPPFDIFGLPRIVSTQDDINYILEAVPTKANGICFCTGSLGASINNDLLAILKNIHKRLHFAHLRNTRRDEFGNFFESDHLDGDTDMYAIMKELVALQQEVNEPIPFRPDHGHQMMDDMQKVTNPGYSCIGRMRGLSELRGLELGLYKALKT